VFAMGPLRIWHSGPGAWEGFAQCLMALVF
jgi:hypothetical protein